MNAPSPHLRPSRWSAALVLFLAVTTGLLFGQSPSTGIITGRVSDAGSGRSLQGAVVRVAGTSLSAFTDPEGRYTLVGVPAGTTSIEVEYVGLDLFKQAVSVTAGASTTLNAGRVASSRDLASDPTSPVAMARAPHIVASIVCPEPTARPAT